MMLQENVVNSEKENNAGTIDDVVLFSEQSFDDLFKFHRNLQVKNI